MAWKPLAPVKQMKNPNTVRFVFISDKNSERISVRIGIACLAAMKWKIGDRVEPVWDDERSLLGFRKSEDGRTITGKHCSGCITFARLDGRAGKAIAAMATKQVEPKVEKNVLVIECAEYLK